MNATPVHTMEQRARAVGCPVVDFDIEDGEQFRQDAFGAFDSAREMGPFIYSTAGRGFWVFSDYEMISETNRRTDLFSNGVVEVYLREAHLMPLMIPEMLDPPVHHPFRKALAPLFTPKAVAEFEGIFRQLCISYIDRIMQTNSCDFMEEFGRPVPADFFLGICGVPVNERDELTDALIKATFSTATEDPTRQIRMESTDKVVKAVQKLVSDHRTQATDDVFSHLVKRPIFDRTLTDEELFSIGLLLVNAGVETTGGALGYMFKHLAENPKDREAIVADPGIIPSAVEEMLRYYPVANSNRVAVGNEDFMGCPVREGDRIVINRIGANRQPDLIPDGDKVILNRMNNNHHTFGNGIHTCLGAHVARRELRIALEEWHKRIPKYRLAADYVPHHHVGTTMSLSTLKLEFDA